MGDWNQERLWFAIQVRTCREKTAATFLQNEGHECFLPLRKSRRRWSDRIKEFEVPLFPGYLFCRFDPHNRLPVLKTPGIIQIVGIGRSPIPVDDDEIAALLCVGINGLAAEPWPFLRIGQATRIEYGPLRGLTGIVVGIKSELKLILSVTLLRRSVAVEVDRDWLSDPHPLCPAAVAIAPGPPTPLAPIHFAAPRAVGASPVGQLGRTNRIGRTFYVREGGIGVS